MLMETVFDPNIQKSLTYFVGNLGHIFIVI